MHTVCVMEGQAFSGAHSSGDALLRRQVGLGVGRNLARNGGELQLLHKLRSASPYQREQVSGRHFCSELLHDERRNTPVLHCFFFISLKTKSLASQHMSIGGPAHHTIGDPHPRVIGQMRQRSGTGGGTMSNLINKKQRLLHAVIALSPVPGGDGGWIGARCVQEGARARTLHGEWGILGGAGCPHANGRRRSVCDVHQPAFPGWVKDSKPGCKVQG